MQRGVQRRTVSDATWLSKGWSFLLWRAPTDCKFEGGDESCCRSAKYLDRLTFVLMQYAECSVSGKPCPALPCFQKEGAYYCGLHLPIATGSSSLLGSSSFVRLQGRYDHGPNVKSEVICLEPTRSGDSRPSREEISAKKKP